MSLGRCYIANLYSNPSFSLKSLNRTEQHLSYLFPIVERHIRQITQTEDDRQKELVFKACILFPQQASKVDFND